MRKSAWVIAVLAACFTASCLSASGIPRPVGYVDDTPDGMRSIAGASEIVEFEMPAGCSQVIGVMIYGGRYGMPQAPNEDFTITVAKKDGTNASTELVPYSTFERGSEKWYTITFKKPIKMKGSFLLAVDFNAQATKGVYVSYDSTSGNKHSYIGSVSSKELSDTGGEWMIKAMVK